MMNNMIGNNIASIEKMTDIIGKKNSDNVDKMYNGKTFADIYNQKRSIEEVITYHIIHQTVTPQVLYPLS